MKRKRPKQPPPRWFDRNDVEMVARCTATIDGARDAKERAHRDAIEGAFRASKDGPPTSRFVWGRLEHFFDHLDRGRAIAKFAERATKARASHSPGQRPIPQPEPAVSPAKARADYELLFGVLR